YVDTRSTSRGGDLCSGDDAAPRPPLTTGPAAADPRGADLRGAGRVLRRGLPRGDPRADRPGSGLLQRRRLLELRGEVRSLPGRPRAAAVARRVAGRARRGRVRGRPALWLRAALLARVRVAPGRPGGPARGAPGCDAAAGGGDVARPGFPCPDEHGARVIDRS